MKLQLKILEKYVYTTQTKQQQYNSRNSEFMGNNRSPHRRSYYHHLVAPYKLPFYYTAMIGQIN